MARLTRVRNKLRQEWHGFGGWRRFHQQWALDRQRCGLAWEPRDLWFGLYWNWPNAARFDLYLVVVPTVPLQLSWKWIGP
jgi:hypothetical protein